MFGFLVKAGSMGLKALAKGLPRNTAVSKMLRAGYGMSSKVAGPVAAGALLGAGMSAFSGSSGGNQLPALPGTGGALMPSQFAKVGTLPFWRGPGGGLQLPWNDPRVPEFLKQFSLDDAYLKPYYRAPKGYVVLRDADGKAFACMKAIAKQFGLWKQKPKPPISIRDWHSYQRAKRVEKKLVKIARGAMHHRGHSVARAAHVVSHRK